MKRFLVFYLFFVFMLQVYSQPTFTKEYPYWRQHSGVGVYAVFAFQDGYALGGVVDDYINYSYSVFLIRTDLNGDTLWIRNLFFKYSQAYSPNIYLKMITDSQGNYFFTYNDFLVKVSSAGDSLWAKKYGGQRIEAITRTNDDRILLGTVGDGRCNLFIINTSGEILEQKLVTTNPGSSFPCSITEMENGNIAYVTLYENVLFINFHGAYIYLFNSFGEVISRWDSWFATDCLTFTPMVASGNDELLCTGSSYMYDYPTFYAKLKTNGTLNWINGKPGLFHWYFSPIVRNTDSTYVFTGSMVNPAGYCIWELFVIDETGKIIWENKHSNTVASIYTLGKAVACRPGGGYAVSGMQRSIAYSDPMLMVIDTTEANGIAMELKTKMQIYPNPSADQVTIAIPNFSFGNYKLEIITLEGCVLDEEPILADHSTFSIQSYSKGLYILKVYKDAQLVGQEKLVKY